MYASYSRSSADYRVCSGALAEHVTASDRAAAMDPLASATDSRNDGTVLALFT